MGTAARWRRLWLALPFVVYLALPTRNFYWDGVSFAINVEKQLPLRETLHPNHLIYTVASLWCNQAALRLGFSIRALFLMQAVNAVLAGAAVILMYRALGRRMAPGPDGLQSAAMAGALSFAFCATWWRYASDANAYIPAIFLILAANDFLERRRLPVVAALLSAGAMLFHELAILYLPVAIYRMRDRKQAARYLAVSLMPVVLAYWSAYRTVFGRFEVRGCWNWITARSPDAGFSFRPFSDFSRSLMGTLRLFFGGKLEFVKLDAVTVVAAAGLLVAVILLARDWRKAGGWSWVRPPGDLLLWLGIYVIFLFFWMPQNTFYRSFYLAPLILAIACSLGFRVAQPRLPWLVCAVLFTWNAAFLVYPESRAENNVPLRFALAQQQRWPAGTPIAFHRFHPDLWTISYFNQQASWIGMESLDWGLLERSLTYAREQQQPLWLEATAHELLEGDAQGRQWLARHEVPGGQLLYQDAKHEYRFYQTR